MNLVRATWTVFAFILLMFLPIGCTAILHVAPDWLQPVIDEYGNHDYPSPITLTTWLLGIGLVISTAVVWVKSDN